MIHSLTWKRSPIICDMACHAAEHTRDSNENQARLLTFSTKIDPQKCLKQSQATSIAHPQPPHCPVHTHPFPPSIVPPTSRIAPSKQPFSCPSRPSTWLFATHSNLPTSLSCWLVSLKDQSGNFPHFSNAAFRRLPWSPSLVPSKFAPEIVNVRAVGMFPSMIFLGEDKSQVAWGSLRMLVMVPVKGPLGRRRGNTEAVGAGISLHGIRQSSGSR